MTETKFSAASLGLHGVFPSAEEAENRLKELHRKWSLPKEDAVSQEPILGYKVLFLEELARDGVSEDGVAKLLNSILNGKRLQDVTDEEFKQLTERFTGLPLNSATSWKHFANPLVLVRYLRASDPVSPENDNRPLKDLADRDEQLLAMIQQLRTVCLTPRKAEEATKGLKEVRLIRSGEGIQTAVANRPLQDLTERDEQIMKTVNENNEKTLKELEGLRKAMLRSGAFIVDESNYMKTHPNLNTEERLNAIANQLGMPPFFVPKPATPAASASKQVPLPPASGMDGLASSCGLTGESFTERWLNDARSSYVATSSNIGPGKISLNNVEGGEHLVAFTKRIDQVIKEIRDENVREFERLRHDIKEFVLEVREFRQEVSGIGLPPPDPFKDSAPVGMRHGMSVRELVALKRMLMPEAPKISPIKIPIMEHLLREVSFKKPITSGNPNYNGGTTGVVGEMLMDQRSSTMYVNTDGSKTGWQPLEMSGEDVFVALKKPSVMFSALKYLAKQAVTLAASAGWGFGAGYVFHLLGWF